MYNILLISHSYASHYIVLFSYMTTVPKEWSSKILEINWYIKIVPQKH